MNQGIRLEFRETSVAFITIETPNQKVNTLRRFVLEELSDLVARLEGQTGLGGAIFRSGKPGQFVAGADLHELVLLRERPEEITRLLDLGNDVFNRISHLPFPTVALIDGPCLGGGLELALSMDERIAGCPEVILGFPEVKLGLIPGWGGTQRLPRLIGYPAIELIGSGETISASRALEIGLVDEVLSTDDVEKWEKQWTKKTHKSQSWHNQRIKLEGPVEPKTEEFRDFISEPLLDEPAACGIRFARLKAIQAMKEGCKLSLQEGLAIERQKANAVFGSSSSVNLIKVFFLKSHRVRNPDVADPSVAPRRIKKVGVIGAGQMGSGIAEAHARSGLDVVLVDLDDDLIEAGLARIHDIQNRRALREHTAPKTWEETRQRISTSTQLTDLAGCDLVIEAVTEDETIKTATFRNLGEILSPSALLASNTSTIPIARMATTTPDPSRFVGMHFFHPVERMELIEVIRGPDTGDEAISSVIAVAKRLDKVPIVVRDCPGFLTTRLLYFYLRESIRILEEGADADAIDIAAVEFGMPMGPLGLMDFIGLDTVSAIFDVMANGYPDRADRSSLLQELVSAGRLGRKTRIGFRNQAKSSGAISDPILDQLRLSEVKPDLREISDRLFFSMLLEATRLLDEAIVREPADVDLGVILGLAFPAHKGGVLRWSDELGTRNVVAKLSQLKRFGARFDMTERLRRMAEVDETFYPSE